MKRTIKISTEAPMGVMTKYIQVKNHPFLREISFLGVPACSETWSIKFPFKGFIYIVLQGNIGYWGKLLSAGS